MKSISFTQEQEALYKKCNIIAKANLGMVGKWIEAVSVIRVQELYLIEGLTWPQWKERYLPGIKPESVDRMVRREREKLPQRTTGEKVLKHTVSKVVEIMPPDTCPASNGETCHNKQDSSPNKAVEQIVPQKKEKVEDDMGTIIPEECLPIWNRRHEIKDLFQKVRSIHTDIENGQKGGDKLFNAINANCLYKLENAWQELKRAYPEVVCGACEGRVPKGGCSVCKSTGFQTKEHYKTSIAIEFRRVRESAIEERKTKHAAKGLPAAVSRLNT